MPYIIDGNNVMGQIPGWHRDKPKARFDLVRQLAEFARIKKARITAVFGWRRGFTIARRLGFPGCEILYADRGSDADTRIEKLVEEAKNPRSLIVVTSDRRLTVEVRAMGANVIRSGEFRTLMAQTRETAPKAGDGEVDRVENVSGWMRYFGVDEDDDTVQ